MAAVDARLSAMLRQINEERHAPPRVALTRISQG
jgi:hypothetical protein